MHSDYYPPIISNFVQFSETCAYYCLAHTVHAAWYVLAFCPLHTQDGAVLISIVCMYELSYPGQCTLTAVTMTHQLAISL